MNVVYIHGWQEYAGNMKSYFNDGNLKKKTSVIHLIWLNLIWFFAAYLERAKLDVNLIAVNWEKSSHTLDYVSAANRVKRIGLYVANLIDFMVDNNLVSLKDIHLIGFSLGAHVAGYAGKNVKSGKLEKIVG